MSSNTAQHEINLPRDVGQLKDLVAGVGVASAQANNMLLSALLRQGLATILSPFHTRRMTKRDRYFAHFVSEYRHAVESALEASDTMTRSTESLVQAIETTNLNPPSGSEFKEWCELACELKKVQTLVVMELNSLCRLQVEVTRLNQKQVEWESEWVRIFKESGIESNRSVSAEEESQNQDAQTSYKDLFKRGDEYRATILAQADMLNSDKAADKIGASRMTVNKYAKEGRLLVLTWGKRRNQRFPKWQFEPSVYGNQGETLASVLKALDGEDPWSKYNFFLRRDGYLKDKTPLQALREGKVDEVLNLARAFAENE